jgi:5-methylcytosine-specific restriction enzyme subunit McrC
MKRLTIAEHESIPIGYANGLTEAEAARLRRFDDAHVARTGGGVFSWSRGDRVKAGGYVGVVRVPGLQIEILPKTDRDEDDRRAQANLLFMLEVAGAIKAKNRSLALLEHEPVSLLDAFVIVFCDSLLDTLQEGLDRTYVTQEGNLRVVRGRILMDQQIRRNAVQKQRVYARYDEFSPDTPLNRVLKAACRILSLTVRSFEAARRLKEIIARFEDVTHVVPSQMELAVELTRQNRRFEPHLNFARLVFAGASTTLSAGAQTSFSLLFQMHRVFEAFVANLLLRHAHELGLGATRIIPQAWGRYLVRDEEGAGFFGLCPDVLALGPGGKVRFVLDTKWKLLGKMPVDDVTRADAYQLHAYAHRFDSSLNVLLYPNTSGSNTVTLAFEGTDRERLLRVAFLDLRRELRREVAGLLDDLRDILSPATSI